MKHIKRMEMKRKTIVCTCLKRKGIVFTCYARNKKFKVQSNLPCLRLERVLDLEVVILNASGFEGKDQGWAFDTGFRKTSEMSFFVGFKGQQDVMMFQILKRQVFGFWVWVFTSV